MTEFSTPDVFVSYKQQDGPRVAALVQRLGEAGFTVWWDPNIPGGAGWRSMILEHLDAARCVVVVWTEASVSAAGEFVHDEAMRARDRGVLLPVRLDAVQPPLGFGQIQSLDLVGWVDNALDPRFVDVVNAARAIAQGTPRPRPVWRRRKAPMTVGAIAATALAVASFFADLPNISAVACRLPVVRSVCGRAGWGGVPSAHEQEAWSQTQGNCDALSDFIKRFPSGSYAEEASRRLAAKRPNIVETWHSVEMNMGTHTVPVNNQLWSTEQAAREDSTELVEVYVKELCALYERGEYRNPYPVANLSWSCKRQVGGWRCEVKAKVACKVEERSKKEVDECK